MARPPTLPQPRPGRPAASYTRARLERRSAQSPPRATQPHGRAANRPAARPTPPSRRHPQAAGPPSRPAVPVDECGELLLPRARTRRQKTEPNGAGQNVRGTVDGCIPTVARLSLCAKAGAALLSAAAPKRRASLAKHSSQERQHSKYQLSWPKPRSAKHASSSSTQPKKGCIGLLLDTLREDGTAAAPRALPHHPRPVPGRRNPRRRRRRQAPGAPRRQRLPAALLRGPRRGRAWTRQAARRTCVARRRRTPCPSRK